MYEITKGKVPKAQKVVLYGPEGIGKSTFAAQFPAPLFIDTEGSTLHMDVARLPAPTSWGMLQEEIRQVAGRPDLCGTLVVDTADWAEQLCIKAVLQRTKKKSIEEFNYGKGYTYVMEEFSGLLTLLQGVVDVGVNVVLTAHAKMRKFEQPNEMGAYDRWEMKLSKNVAPLVKEWADMVLFANYKTYTVKRDDGKVKAQGGDRVMYTSHHACWDAKNRHGLPEEMPLEYRGIAHIFAAPVTRSEPPAGTTTQPGPPPIMVDDAPIKPAPAPAKPEKVSKAGEYTAAGIPAKLAELMAANEVEPEEIQWAVAFAGKQKYYPEDTPIRNYDPAFVDQVLVGAWPNIYKAILDNRDVPF